MKKSSKAAVPALLQICCRVLDEKKAGDLRVFDVSEQSSITDYLVLATATSGPHLRAMRVELEKAIDAAKVRIVGTEAGQDSGWVVVDLFDVMVHLFLGDQPSHYGLERLWKDATEIPLAAAIATEPRPRAAKKSARPATRAVRKQRK